MGKVWRTIRKSFGGEYRTFGKPYYHEQFLEKLILCHDKYYFMVNNLMKEITRTCVSSLI